MAAQGTPSYVYFTDQQLGLGASGSVYLGRHKVLHLYTFCTSNVWLGSPVVSVLDQAQKGPSSYRSRDAVG